MGAGGIEPCKDTSNRWARKGAATLRRCKIIAEAGLQFLYGGAEADDIVLRERG